MEFITTNRNNKILILNSYAYLRNSKKNNNTYWYYEQQGLQSALLVFKFRPFAIH